MRQSLQRRETSKIVPVEWLDELERYVIENLGFSEDLAKKYREEGAWEDYYADDFSPVEAVEEDRDYW